jgi:TadE-like protein
MAHEDSFCDDCRGSVYVEFLVAFLPFLMLVLCIIQTALMFSARATVQRSANAATRAAVVVLDDDPVYYSGAPRNSVTGGGTRGTDPVDQFLQWMGWGSSAPQSISGNARLQDIHAAASIPLLSIAPPIPQASVKKAIGRGLGATNAAAAADYNRTAVEVSFPNAPLSATTGKTSWGLEEDVTVRVRYQFHCAVPVARLVMCDHTADTGRFIVLVAEATLPNMGASYAY